MLGGQEKLHTELTKFRLAEVLPMSGEVAVLPLSERNIPWFARIRLRRAKGRRRTGLLLSAIIRTGSRAMTFKHPYVSIREGKRRLCMCSSTSKFPKFVALEPGVHLLTFSAGGGGGIFSHSSFTRSVTLQYGDILVAVCEPIQPWVFYAKSPSVDRWHIGVEHARIEDRVGS